MRKLQPRTPPHRPESKHGVGPVVVGLDPSYGGFGFAAYCPSTGVHFSQRYKGRKDGPERLIDIREWLRGRLDHYEPVLVCMEGYSFGSKFKREVMGELGGVVKVLLFEMFAHRAVGVRVIAPDVLKKWATGKGNSAKEMILMACLKKYGIEFGSNDEADAYVLARMAAAILGVEEPGPAYEREVLDKLMR